MSGGSLNYLCYKEPGDLFIYINEMEEVEQVLLGYGAKDIALDVRRLIEYVQTAENRIRVLAAQLTGIFRAVEWWLSGDSGDDHVKKIIEEYRKGEPNT